MHHMFKLKTVNRLYVEIPLLCVCLNVRRFFLYTHSLFRILADNCFFVFLVNVFTDMLLICYFPLEYFFLDKSTSIVFVYYPVTVNYSNRPLSKELSAQKPSQSGRNTNLEHVYKNC